MDLEPEVAGQVPPQGAVSDEGAGAAPAVDAVLGPGGEGNDLDDIAGKGAAEGAHSRRVTGYDGSVNLSDYLAQFEIVAELAGWDTDRAALELAAALRGPALSVLGDLDPEVRGHWPSLIDALRARFEPDSDGELCRVKLHQLLRQGRSLVDLAHEA